MGNKEKEVINAVLMDMDPDTERLFRINAGVGWAGELIRGGGVAIIKNPRPFRAAPEGWPDLCGWRSVEITPDMVGQKLAVFMAVEVKTGKQGLRKKQKDFKSIIEKMGGIWRTVRE